MSFFETTDNVNSKYGKHIYGKRFLLQTYECVEIVNSETT